MITEDAIGTDIPVEGKRKHRDRTGNLLAYRGVKAVPEIGKVQISEVMKMSVLGDIMIVIQMPGSIKSVPVGEQDEKKQ